MQLEDVFADLWSEFGPGIQRLATTYEADPQSREDLLQDIRVAIWMALPRFRSESSLRTFVFRIAHNRASTHVWRSLKAKVARGLDGLELHDPRTGPEGVAVQNLDKERLMNAIRSLPIPTRQVIVLALEDLPHEEMASMLGTTENNIGVRLNRARAHLRRALGEYD